MAKKNMQSVVAALTPIAETLPTQQTPELPPEKPVPGEPTVQFSMSLRKSLRKELSRLSDDHDMPMRAFVRLALKEKGLNVLDSDLADMRKR